jgi:hypothetical protein
VDCLGFGRHGGEERGLGLCGGEERGGSGTASAIPGPFHGEEKQSDDVSAVEKAIPGLCGGEGECDGGGTTGGGGSLWVRQPRWRRSSRRRLIWGSAAAVEKKQTTAIELGFGRRERYG